MKAGRLAVERLLKANPDGLTIRQLAEALNIDRRRIESSIKLMPHVYVDRWIAVPFGHHFRWSAVYMLADIPEDMPIPNWTPTIADL